MRRTPKNKPLYFTKRGTLHVNGRQHQRKLKVRVPVCVTDPRLPENKDAMKWYLCLGMYSDDLHQQLIWTAKETNGIPSLKVLGVEGDYCALTVRLRAAANPVALNSLVCTAVKQFNARRPSYSDMVVVKCKWRALKEPLGCFDMWVKVQSAVPWEATAWRWGVLCNEPHVNMEKLKPNSDYGI